MKRQLLLSLIVLQILNGCPALAAVEKKAAAEQEQYLTKGEAIMLISATDFMKKKIGELLSWTVGYDVSKVSRVKMTPTINYVKAIPKRIPPDGRTVLELQASVDDPGGLSNIAGVRADLSAIGRLPNTMLVDNGLFGDRKPADGVYTLQSSVALKTKTGPKEISVAVANKKGWLALTKATLDVAKNPVIIEVRLNPEETRGGQITITLHIDNPGRFEDLQEVTANLKSLGYREPWLFRRAEGKPGNFIMQFNLPENLTEGSYPIIIEATNLSGGYVSQTLNLKVRK
jgi:hypothetical protein